MRKILPHSLVLTAAAFLSIGPAAFAQNSLPAVAVHKVELVDSNSPEFMRRLERTPYKRNLLALANHFETQMNKAFCGPTSSVIVLNALTLNNPRYQKPLDAAAYLPESKVESFEPSFKKFTQQNFFNEKTDRIKTRAEVEGQPNSLGVSDGGYTLRQLGKTLETFGVSIKLVVAGSAAKDYSIREDLIGRDGLPGRYTIVNYFRPALGPAGRWAHLAFGGLR